MPSDLLRALFVRDAEAMLTALFGDRRDDLAYDDFDAARRSLRARSEDLPRAAEDLTLPRWWARRWALVLDSRGPAPLTPMGFLQSLDGATLRSLDWLSDAHREGLITSEEALARRLASMIDQGCPVLAPMTPAYLDRHQGLDALSNAIGGPVRGAVLVGQPGSGRPGGAAPRQAPDRRAV